ncbi:MAG: DNA repair protein RecN [Longilinea sp.]|nr:DNA repair protein RecN [Longilinea sp.]MCA1954967.1 DNA repair protein RecN [Anaerolinea sp.]
MLLELRIQNFAILQEVTLNFAPGLTTFTGETGAGKSILLDAITALVGGRADVSMIRSGADRAILEATFRIPVVNGPALREILAREDLLDNDEELTLGRELRSNGRSVARVNGRSVNVSLLREIGSYLVDIHGQSEHLSLLDVRQHLGLLDRWAGSEAALAAYRQTYQRYQTVQREWNRIRQSEQDAARRADLLSFQLQEIEGAQIRLGEEEELRLERNRLANAESLASLAEQALLLLEEGLPESPSLSDLLGQLVQALHSLERLDPQQAALGEQAQTLTETISDLGRSLRLYLEQIEPDPHRLDVVEERLELFHQLKRKYGGSLESVLAYAQAARQELDGITHAAERLAELEMELNALRHTLAGQAQALSTLRHQAAQTLSKGVEAELNDLRMAGARFEVELRYESDLTGLVLADGQVVAFDETGCDRAEFLIAPNPGEGLKPLVKIASGGETSRLMLALKRVLTQADAIPTLIFDEIDQGIGGRVGTVVGEKLWELGRAHQVLCVTHLPQLAAFGDQHFRVRKQVQDGRTLTMVELLDGDARRDELAAMIGSLSEAGRSAAEEALALARQRAAAARTH